VTKTPDRDDLGAETAASWWQRLQRRLLAGRDLTPLRISLVYTVLGFGALLVSDVLLVRYLDDPLLSQVQTLKGVLEIVLSAVLILALTSARELQLQRALSHLGQRNARLQVLYRVFRHDLRNDLNVIQGYTEHLQRRECRDADPEPFDEIFDTVGEIERYTEQVRRIKKITESEERHSYDLSETIPRVVATHPLVTDAVELSVRVPDGVTVETNRMFGRALAELVTNAIQHNESDRPRVRVTVEEATSPPDAVDVRVADDGPGISAREREALHSGSEDQVHHLSGLGLWFVKWTADHSGGKIHVEDNEWGGTTVVYRLPTSGAVPTVPAATDRWAV
jgi:signal transduction histidine kinase